MKYKAVVPQSAVDIHMGFIGSLLSKSLCIIDSDNWCKEAKRVAISEDDPLINNKINVQVTK